MISKELFETILRESIDEICHIHMNLLWYKQDGKEYNINIYELAYLCKEWARDNNYNVSACKPIVANDEGKVVVNYWYKSYIQKFEIGSYYPPEQILFFDVNTDNEPEAVFKACEYVLKVIK